MNTKLNFNRRVVFTISVLLTATWISLPTFAQDITETNHLQNLPDCEKSTEVLTASTVLKYRALKQEVGFSETDPSEQQTGLIKTVTRTSIVRVHEIVGFSETDPADQQSENIETFTRTFIVRAHVNVEFSETDPAADMFSPFGETDYQTLADCSDKKAKVEIPEKPKFSSLTVKGNYHEYS